MKSSPSNPEQYKNPNKLTDIPNLREVFLESLVAEPAETSIRNRPTYQLGGELSTGVVMPRIYIAHNMHNGRRASVGYGSMLDENEGLGVRIFSPGHLAKAIVHETSTVTELEEISRFIDESPLRDFFVRESQKDIVEVLSGRPTLINEFAKASDQNSAAHKMSEVNKAMAEKAMKLVIEDWSDGETAKLVADWLSDSDDEHILSVTRFLETRLRRTLMEGTRHPELVLGFVEVLDDKGLLRNPAESGSVIGQPGLLMKYPKLVEILQTNLLNRTTDESKSYERKYLLLARGLIHGLLEKFSHDPDRYQSNAQKALSYIFPNQARPDTMNRANLVALANHVNSELAGGAQYKATDSGVTANAFNDIMSITRSHDTDIAAKQELEDRLYANVIGMMLEQRNVAAAALRSASQEI